MNKRFLSVALTGLMLCETVFGSVLGSSKINGYELEIGQGTTLYHNQWYSDQSGVGRQTENYIVYKPNEDVKPIITFGERMYGKSTATAEAQRLTNEGYDIIGGVNADFFSLETGVPMSNLIVDGKIITKDAQKQYAFGIDKDGNSFVSEGTIFSVMKKADGTEVNIYNINKYRQPYAIYMMTEEFSTETHNNTDGIDVILTVSEGERRLGTDMRLVVDSVDEYNGSIKIPEGKVVLTVDKNAPEEFLEPIKSLEIGEEITISFGIMGDERWKNADLLIGATGGMLLSNGNVNTNLKAGADPRTAIGRKNDGSIVFYTLDGRQADYSYGAQLKTLANRMKELGCVDAINLDGGGSTTCVVRLPGEKEATVINKPSDGRERKVANFFFLKNEMEKTGDLEYLTIYPLMNYVLKGASVQLTAKGMDGGYHPVDVRNVKFSIEKAKNSDITRNGLFTADETGVVTVSAVSQGVEAYADIVCLDTPTDIYIKKENTAYSKDEIVVKRGEKIDLTAESYGGFNLLVSDDSCYEWDCDEEIGKIDDEGVFKAGDVMGKTGLVMATAGDKTGTKTVRIMPNGTEEKEKLYSYAEVEKDGTDLYFKIKSYYGLEVKADGIKLRADGRGIAYDYNEETEVLHIENYEKYDKITLYITNTVGYTTKIEENKGLDGNAENPFVDTKGNWAESLINYMYKTGIVSGEKTNSGLKFNPQKEMTRSEFAVMITNYLRIDVDSYADVELPYKDVEEIPAWALNSFKALYKWGTVKGRKDTDGGLLADPKTSINRAEAVTIISRTIPSGLKKAEIKNTDKGDIADWAKEGFEILVGIGAVNGYEDGSIKPKKNLTKAEAAKILYNIM